MEDVLTKEILQKVRQVEIRTNRLVNDSLAGHYHSVFKGRGMSFEEVGQASRSDTATIASSLAYGDTDDALSMTTMKEIKSTIAQNIDLLPEKEKLVISLYYSDELTMKEIGKVMDITESRVSQIHAQAIIHLRGKLRREGLLED